MALTLQDLNEMIDGPEFWIDRNGPANNRDEELIPSGRTYGPLLGDHIALQLECVQTSGNNLDCLIHAFLMATCPAFRRRIRMNGLRVTNDCGANQFATYFRTTIAPRIIESVYEEEDRMIPEKMNSLILKSAADTKHKTRNITKRIVNALDKYVESETTFGSRRPKDVLIKELLREGAVPGDLADDHLSCLVTYFNTHVLLIRNGALVIGDDERSNSSSPTYIISNPRAGHFECVRTGRGMGIRPGQYKIEYGIAQEISIQLMNDAMEHRGEISLMKERKIFTPANLRGNSEANLQRILRESALTAKPSRLPRSNPVVVENDENTKIMKEKERSAHLRRMAHDALTRHGVIGGPERAWTNYNSRGGTRRRRVRRLNKTRARRS